MKKIILLVSIMFVLLISCSGSDSYQGKWKATDPDGGKFEINFSPKEFTLKDSTGKTANYSYSQNSVKYENSIEIYGIKLDDGRTYEVYFPTADETTALLKDQNGRVLFTMNRNEYVTQDDVYRLD